MATLRERKFSSAKKFLREIEEMLAPYKKRETAEPYSTRGEWRSARQVIVEEEPQRGKEAAARTN